MSARERAQTQAHTHSVVFLEPSGPVRPLQVPAVEADAPLSSPAGLCVFQSLSRVLC